MPIAKRNATLVLLDVDTQPDFLEKSRKCLLNICVRKWIAKSKDIVKVMLLNCAQTNNTFHTEYGKCPHIAEVSDEMLWDPALLSPLIKDVQTGKGDWLLGLSAALEAIKNTFYNAKGIMNIHLLFLTDFSHNANFNDKRVDFIIQQLKTMNVFICILGPEVKIPELLTWKNVNDWSKHIEFVDKRNANLEAAKCIVTKTKGFISNLQVGEELIQTFVEHSGLQPWKVALTIGSKLSIPCSTVRFLREQDGPKISKVSAGTIKSWSWHMVEDISEVVPVENVIGGVYTQNKFVALPQDVERNFKFQGERCFKIIGFTDIANISEFYMGSEGSYYVENANSKTFDLLLNHLSKQNKCIIAQRVYMKNTKPKLVVLLPQIKERVFLLVELPYDDDILGHCQEQDLNKCVKWEKEIEPETLACNFLRQLDIGAANNCDKNGSVKWPLSGELMGDAYLKFVGERCVGKYLDEFVPIKQDPDVVLPRLVDDYSELKKFLTEDPDN